MKTNLVRRPPEITMAIQSSILSASSNIIDADIDVDVLTQDPSSIWITW